MSAGISMRIAHLYPSYCRVFAGTISAVLIASTVGICLLLSIERPAESHNPYPLIIIPVHKTWRTVPIIWDGLIATYIPSRANTRIPTSDFWGASCPAWSPNYDKIAYSFLRYDPADGWKDSNVAGVYVPPDSQQGLYVTNIDGSGEKHLTNYYDDTPSWSPNGLEIAFTHFRRQFYPQIDIYNFKTGDIRRFSNPSLLCLHPSWSPDGKTIAYSTISDSGHWIITLQNIVTNRITRLSALPLGYSDFPRWSPNSKQLLFSYSKYQDWSNATLFTIHSDGTKVHRLPLHDVLDFPAAWSPDGKRIVYAVLWRHEHAAVDVCDPDGQNVWRFGQLPNIYYSFEYWPTW
jgi:Tol biopolymer transport system component